MTTYNPFDWYWLADDARLFSSSKQALVASDDPDYVAWSDAGNAATGWPRDDAGNQTDAALQAVLEPYELFVNLTFYNHYKRWRTEQSGVTVSVGSSTFPIKTDDRSQAKINGLQLAVTANNLNNSTTPFYAADGAIYTIDGPQASSLHDQLQMFINDCFGACKVVDDGITGGTITTRAQVDAQYATIPTTHPAAGAR
ncbi:DUF4376 domain-containing protein [Bradyrhizobium sp. BRP22]|uniref:DUF4376 domain-containing protein n=1 Tax=Bradyrhizobium sp. BRP22 TaxID=2793821 RepID=UPI001CD62151|nr:DUF4376 domain-containing protein [Bradyrhizobium sp. BRP22]MCA1452825.1 DUF4376 domain-containing protein [Bradyrhizobium sp. BRP22]